MSQYFGEFFFTTENTKNTEPESEAYPKGTLHGVKLHRESVFFNNLKILSNLFFYFLCVLCVLRGSNFNGLLIVNDAII